MLQGNKSTDIKRNSVGMLDFYIKHVA